MAGGSSTDPITQTYKPTKQVPRLIGNGLVGFFDAVTVNVLVSTDVNNVKNSQKTEIIEKY